MTSVWPVSEVLPLPFGEREGPAAEGGGRVRETKMQIVETTKFVIGIGILVSSRGTRGFGQRKQAGLLLLVAAAVFFAIGLGYDPRALFRQ